jgi:PAS domain S-box-containing protein
LDAGADDYMVKPFSARELLARVAMHIRSGKIARAREEHFREMADAAPAILWTTDTSNGCTFLSRKWCEYTGQHEAQALGLGWTEAMHADDRAGVMSSFRAASVQRQSIALDYRLRLRDGRYRWVIGVGDPRFDERGRWLGYIGTVIDAHERKLAEEALREREQQLALALAGAHAGVWALDIASLETFWSEEFEALYGYDAATPRHYSRWIASVHPDDRERVEADLRARFASGPSEFSEECRIVHPQHGPRWMLNLGRIERGPGGEARRCSGISIDITDRKLAEEALKEADRRKDEFLATLAHELRNPLAPIRTGIELLRLADNPAARERCIGIMERQTAQLTRLIDDLLDVSRITHGKVQLHRSKVDLRKVIQTAIEAVQPLIDAAAHDLTVELPEESVFVEADLARLSQVFSNLLSNAAKYTPRGGRVRLTASADNEGVRVVVADNGIGIRPEDLPRVFDMFVQIDRMEKREYAGLGIGLALVKSLVQMHGGTVSAHSAGPSQGSEFVVRLPGVLQAGASRAPNTGAQSSATTARRVLVVDDNEDAAELLSLAVKSLGNEVGVAHDGLEALELASVFRPEIILMDMGMPRMDGYEAARRIREQSWARGITLVAVTGWGQAEDRRKTREAGFDHHLVKPAELTALAAILQGPATIH